MKIKVKEYGSEKEYESIKDLVTSYIDRTYNSGELESIRIRQNNIANIISEILSTFLKKKLISIEDLEKIIEGKIYEGIEYSIVEEK